MLTGTGTQQHCGERGSKSGTGRCQGAETRRILPARIIAVGAALHRQPGLPGGSSCWKGKTAAFTAPYAGWGSGEVLSGDIKTFAIICHLWGQNNAPEERLTQTCSGQTPSEPNTPSLVLCSLELTLRMSKPGPGWPQQTQKPNFIPSGRAGNEHSHRWTGAFITL